MPALMGVGRVRHFVFRTISQIAFEYRRSLVSAGVAGSVYAGDRLPWVSYADRDNYASLRSLDWQVHVYGEAPGEVRAVCAEAGLEHQEFPWAEAARAAGLERDALYLVRPDGYVGLAAPKRDIAALTDYLSRLQLRPRAPGASAAAPPTAIPGYTAHTRRQP